MSSSVCSTPVKPSRTCITNTRISGCIRPTATTAITWTVRLWQDWVERIPFSETRNYVQRVLEGTQVYRNLLAARGPLPKLTLADDMIGAAPR